MGSTRTTDDRTTIAIVGGGASGTLTALHLLRQAAARRLALRVALIDRYGRHAQGQAYSTPHEAHLLNTMASQMSALPDEPDHLIRWAGVPAGSFLPRRVYGRYLQATLAEAERQASSAVQLTRITSEVTAIGRGAAGRTARLASEDGWLEADTAVLALGPVTAGLPFPVPASSRVIADPWRPGALDGVTDDRPAVIVGTGLTMMDLAIALGDQSPGTKIYAVSRHGLLPRPHPDTLPGARPVRLPALRAARGRVRLTELITQVREAVAADPERWPDVVGSVRPYVPHLWRGLPEGDKRLFLQHLARYWEVHRHLVPPATASRVADLRKAGRLMVVRGRVAEVAGEDGRFQVRIDGPASGDLTAGWIINAMGAATDIAATADPLVNDLLASGTARPDSVRLGLDAAADGALIDASGSASHTLYTLGPPLRGLWYETTSIPEIRDQAATLARRLTNNEVRARRSGAAGLLFVTARVPERSR